ncbi:MAG: SEC-C metal-binding domain-containing protein [Pseudomonadota bacterium]
MGAIADAIVDYAQPLLDKTDGSLEQVNKAFALSQMCWNLALLPEEARGESLAKMRPTLTMDDDEFDTFRRTVVIPMIRRHEEMFPSMHHLDSTEPSEAANTPLTRLISSVRTKKYPGTGRNEPCPCGSGKKYKKCCGASESVLKA